MFNKLKTAFVLVVIGGLSGAIIFGVNELTYKQIEENLQEQEESYYKEIFNLSDDDVIYLEYLELDGALDQEITIRENDEFGDIIGYVYKDATKNNYGDITVLVGIKLDGTISNVVIASTGNTPTFVNKIKSKYLVNFVDQDISDVTIDTFTGASYTYGSVVETVELANTYYSMNRGDE